MQTAFLGDFNLRFKPTGQNYIFMPILAYELMPAR